MHLAYAKRILLLAIVLLLALVSTQAGGIKGKIIDSNNSPLPGASVKVSGTQQGAIADDQGIYEIKNLKAGTYTLSVSYLGYKTAEKELTIDDKENLEVNFSLEEKPAEIGEVVISERSTSRKLSENPIQISSIDVTKLQSESSDVVSVLDRTAGVRIRQSGGLGSNTTIQLNGLSGRAVRTYYDGIPLELLGGGIQLNNIPVNAIERVDVYKGVMPVDVGTDALAGGINVITKQVDYDYLDASYQFGSFNTHVGTLNASKKLGKHLMFSFSGFYNYSDNNYNIRARQRTPDFKEIEVEVERFHSVHQSSMLMGTIGLIDVKWADKLSYSASYNQRFDEIQHGVRIGNNAVGEANLTRNAFLHILRYQKALFKDKLTVDYFGNFSFANENIDDSTLNVYNWSGEVIATNNRGVEVLFQPSFREGIYNSQVHRLNLAWQIKPSHTLKVSSFLSDQSIEGDDPLAARINGVDPNAIPSFLTRSISGISYESQWIGGRLESIFFGKYYYYDQSAADFRPSTADQIFEFRQENDETGYGAGLKFSINENFFIRSSYEQAIRIPTKDEVFGDFLTIEPNFALRPEKSKNLNAGFFFKQNIGTERYISLDANWFLRDQTDLIRLEPGRNENDPAQFVNENEADASGIELTLSAVPIKGLELTGSLTLQEVIKDGIPNPTNSNGIGSPIPNIPTTFYNLSARYQFDSPLAQKDDIFVFAYYTFVDEFDLIFQTSRNKQNIIPTQRQLDAGFTYRIDKARLSLTLEAGNVLDAEVFDNFRVPKPGRNFSIKLRYLFQKL